MNIIFKTMLASTMIIFIAQLPTTILAQKDAPTPSCWSKCRSCLGGCLKATAAVAEPILEIAGTAITIALPEAAPIVGVIQTCFAASQPALLALSRVCNDATVTTPATFLKSLSDNGVAPTIIDALVSQLKATGIDLSAGDEATILKVKKIVSLALVASQAAANGTTTAEPSRSIAELGTPAIRMLSQENFERRFRAEFETQEALK